MKITDLLKNKAVVIGGIIVLIAIAAAMAGKFWPRATETATIDDLPIWVLDNGATVYRELEFDGKKLTRNIVIQNLDGVTDSAKIYETIPKEIAASAKDLQFNVEPQVIEDDPVVLWSVCKKNCGKEQGVLDMTATLAKGIITTVRDAGLHYFSDVCTTKTAKDWLKKAGYKEGEFFGCSQYIRYMEKDVALRKTAEWQNKLEQGKIKNTYEPTASEYKIYQQTAQKAISEQKKTQQQTQTKTKTQQTTTPAKKSDPCQYCSQIKCGDCKSGIDICRSDKTGCTSCNTDADCLDTHFCSNGAGCFLKESEIRKRNKK